MFAVVSFMALSMFMPLLSYFGAAAVALVTLRQGAVAGLILVAGSTVFLGLVSGLSGFAQSLLPSVISLGVLSLLLWGLAVVLRQTRSLALTLLAGAGAGAVGIVLFYALVDDSVQWWQAVLREWFGPAIEQAAANAQDMYLLIDGWAPHMTGFLASAIMVNTVICLFMARWWQAVLYNPGGFRQEFYGLHLGKYFAIGTLVVGVMTMLPLGVVQLIAADFLMLAMTLFVLQGLSVVHTVIAKKGLQNAWLFGVYVVVVLMSQLIAMVGFVDTWADLRNRIKPASPG